MSRPITNTTGTYRNNGIHKRNAQNHRDYVRNRRNKRKQILVEQFGDKCHDCGNSYPVCCYDFHHIDERTKLFEIAPALDGNMDRIFEEVKKCVMLCSNCHRIRHAK